MRHLRHALPAMLLLLAACSSLPDDIRVSTVKDPAVDLHTRRTYSWSTSVGAVTDSTGTWGRTGMDLDAELRSAIGRQLRAAGYSEVHSGADVNMALLMLGDRAEIEKVSHEPGARADPSILTEGALLVEMIDAKTGRVLWRGGAQSSTQAVHTQAETTERIDDAVAEMFKDFHG
ncbi:MAG TPA: DUF4136 domain-containing protein [Planctomycetota bacterium]|nr:DUF4136 domain-containing protein [Planctomycetota bacterium]